ncbi:MAG: peptide chain release factor N(5)-glutamine methyltransferase [Thermomicrobiales bacterium]
MKLKGSSPEPELIDGELTIASVRASGRKLLESVSETPGLDADVLLEHVTGLDRAGLFARSTEPLDHVAVERYQSLLERRLAGEPVAYMIGSRSFRTIDLIVDARVLVPRPETELLVEAGLAALSGMAGKRRVLDLGTGSGAIALALAAELPVDHQPEISIVASDISQDALDVARTNRTALGLDDRVELIQSNLFDRVAGCFDVVLANLPYLRQDQRHRSTAREPELALFAGDDGLDQYRRMFAGISKHLSEGGFVAVEIDPDQSAAVRGLADASIGGAVVVLKDLAGLDRAVAAGTVDIVRTVAETTSHGT